MNFCESLENYAVDGLESQSRGVGKAFTVSVVVLFCVSFASSQYAGDVEWTKPFNPAANEMPKHFDSSNSDQYFYVHSDAKSSGTFYLEEKSASSTSWSTVDSSQYKDEWGSNFVMFGGYESFNVELGDSETVTINGVEHTFEVVSIDLSENSVDNRIDGTLSNYYNGVLFLIDSQRVQVHDLNRFNNSKQIEDGQYFNFSIDGTDHSIFLDSVQDANPHTIAYSVDGGSLQNAEKDDVFTVDGEDVVVTDIVPLGSGTGAATFSVQNVGGKFAEYRIYDRRSLSDGGYEYRARYENENPIRPLVFDVGSNDGFNIPYVENISVDSNQIFDFSTGSARPGSSISATIKQKEGDKFNATLIDRSTGTEVVELQNNGSGALQGIYNSILESSLGVFSDVSGFQSSDLSLARFQIPQDSSLLSQSASSYDLGLKIEDTSTDPALVRNTADYSVDTSGSNDVPNITAVEGYNAGAWVPVTDLDQYGDSFSKIRLTVDDENDDTHYVSLKLTAIYD